MFWEFINKCTVSSYIWSHFGDLKPRRLTLYFALNGCLFLLLCILINKRLLFPFLKISVVVLQVILNRSLHVC